ncbi:uncharacterized protein LOC141907719 [Tubulanus polymorphus]|uniref:uncharacterized protein LOC141907719 n=1 Tax=Tubulanus polymorphus TaxID=672921 RepID=UPI003DA2BBE9
MSSGRSHDDASQCVDGTTSDYCETLKERNPWLIVDLGSRYVVHEVIVWYRTYTAYTGYCSIKKRKLRWRVVQSRVGDSNNLTNPLCANYTDVKYECGNHVSKRCNEALVGRYVSVQVIDFQRLKLTEVQVIGFKYIDPTQCTYPGSFGCMAEAQCNLNVPNRVDYLTGYCHNGCNANYIGQYCDKEFKLTYTMKLVSQIHSVNVTISNPRVPNGNMDSGKGSIRVGYHILYRKVGDKDWIVGATEPPAKPGASIYVIASKRDIVISGLTANTQYEFTATAWKIDADLSSTLTEDTRKSYVYTLCHEPLVGPDVASLKQQRVADSPMYNVYVRHEPLARDQRRCDAPGTIYRIFIQSTTNDTWMNIGQSYNIPGLRPLTKYRLKIGIKHKGNANFVFGKIHEFLTGSAVTHLTAKNTSFGLNVTWKTPFQLRHLQFNFTGEYRLISQLACPKQKPSQKTKGCPFPTDINELELVELRSYANYEVTITPVSLNDESNMERESVAFNVTTKQSAPVGTPRPAEVRPQDVSLSTIKETTWASVRFYELSCESRKGNFTGFHYKLYEKNSGELVQENVTMDYEYVYIDGLKPFTTYLLSYTWTNEAGESQRSNSTEFKTDETTLLEVQMKINPVDRNEDNLDFTVDFTFDQIRGEVLNYALQCGETTGEGVKPKRPSRSYWNINVSSEHLPFNVYNLKPATWYGCRGSALSKKGWGPSTAYVYVLTDG